MSLLAQDLLDRAMFRKLITPYFKAGEPRVSSISQCERYQVAVCLGEVEPKPFDIYYDMLGNGIESWIWNKLRDETKEAYWQCNVPTTCGEVNCHPDIFLVSADENYRHAIQVKTCDAKFIRSDKPKRYAYQQAMLEWEFWRMAGGFRDRSGQFLGLVPTTYEILYATRENPRRIWDEETSVVQEDGSEDTPSPGGSAGLWRSHAIAYDAKVAGQLRAKFEAIYASIQRRELPRRPYNQAGWECRGCPLRNGCWGS